MMPWTPARKQDTVVITDEYGVRMPQKYLKRHIAKMAGNIVSDILMDTGIEKDSPLYIDANPEYDMMRCQTAITVEVGFTPLGPQRLSIEPVPESEDLVLERVRRSLERNHGRTES